MKKIYPFLLSTLVATGAVAGEFKTNAKSAFLIDFDSGAEIVAKSADTLMPRSSMLKLMTLAVLFDRVRSGELSLDDKLPVGKMPIIKIHFGTRQARFACPPAKKLRCVTRFWA